MLIIIVQHHAAWFVVLIAVYSMILLARNFKYFLPYLSNIIENKIQLLFVYLCYSIRSAAFLNPFLVYISLWDFSGFFFFWFVFYDLAWAIFHSIFSYHMNFSQSQALLSSCLFVQPPGRIIHTECPLCILFSLCFHIILLQSVFV